MNTHHLQVSKQRVFGAVIEWGVCRAYWIRWQLSKQHIQSITRSELEISSGDDLQRAKQHLEDNFAIWL